jgi:hypothetical protein
MQIYANIIEICRSQYMNTVASKDVRNATTLPSSYRSIHVGRFVGRYAAHSIVHYDSASSNLLTFFLLDRAESIQKVKNRENKNGPREAQCHAIGPSADFGYETSRHNR